MNYWDIASMFSPAAMVYNTYGRGQRTILADMTGLTSKRNTQQSYSASMDYEQYLKGAYERQLADWNRNVGWQGKQIAYPELAYSGKIRGADTSVARSGFSYDNADASYRGSLPYRAAGLYGVFSRVARTL